VKNHGNWTFLGEKGLKLGYFALFSALFGAKSWKIGQIQAKTSKFKALSSVCGPNTRSNGPTTTT